jgi:hypothetical protein
MPNAFTTKPPSLLPDTIDWWLAIVTRPSHAGSIRGKHVTCLVESVCVQVDPSEFLNPPPHLTTTIQAPETDGFCHDEPTYTLYISALRSDGPPVLRRSPLAVLDRFVGHPCHQYGPDWTQWKQPSVTFEYPVTTFAEFFRHMATWKENSDQVSLFDTQLLRAN